MTFIWSAISLIDKLVDITKGLIEALDVASVAWVNLRGLATG